MNKENFEERERYTSVKILYCGCKHSYQDQKYGIGKRVFNQLAVADKDNPKYRCTVCKNERGK
jgi:hypothetical protein